MANVRHIVTPPGKAPVEFFAPEGADDAQLQQLATQALAQSYPSDSFVTPVLDAGTRKSLERPLTQDEILSQQGGMSAPEPTLAGGAADRIRETLVGWGLDPYVASREAENITSGLSFLPGPGTAVSLDDARLAAKEGRYGAALGNLGAAALDVVPGVGKGASALAMFLGPMAKNANLDMLKKAEQMLEQGADRKQVWDETGWFKGADGKMRFEVPDNDMSYVPYILEGKDEPIPLDRIVKHDALEKAYPLDFANLKVLPERDRTRSGAFYPDDSLITLDTVHLPETIRSTAAHELQHFVQGQEGFASGGRIGSIAARDVNPELKPLYDRMSEIDKARVRIYATAKDWETGKFPAQEALDQLESEREGIMAQVKKLRPDAEQEGYRRLAGEVEARNVETRLDMTPGQRREYAPWETQDFPEEEQFVVFRGDGPQMSLDDPKGTVRAYHGTRSEFDEFGRVDEGNANGPGYYFTTDPEAASRYAMGENVNRITLEGNAGPNVRPVDLTFADPFKGADPADAKLAKRLVDAQRRLNPENAITMRELKRNFDRPAKARDILQFLTYNAGEQNAILREAGFDAVVGGYGADDIMVFDPANIKSPFASPISADPPGTFNPKMAKELAKAEGVHIDAHESDGTVYLNAVERLEGSSPGAGARAIREILSEADRAGLPVRLRASASGDSRPQSGLMDYYRQFGFEEVSPDTSEMVRPAPLSIDPPGTVPTANALEAFAPSKKRRSKRR